MSEYKIYIKGLVQGVGFRPFIYRLGKLLNIDGEVKNNNEGVYISFNTTEQNKRIFLQKIINEKPISAYIENVEVREGECENIYDGFRIIESNTISSERTDLSPDIATCEDCLEELNSNPLRLSYPFINCTNCGPRFSIINHLPYDRKSTSMKDFELCHECNNQYKDITDRRFHAQPIACIQCGPRYKIDMSNNLYKISLNLSESEQIRYLAEQIEKGMLVALKGIGGYTFICDAFNNRTISKLKNLKKRNDKPLAVMYNNIDAVKENLYVSKKEESELLSWRRPIVLLKQKKIVSNQINDFLDRLGVILPYAPIHSLLFSKLKTKALIFTSANISNSPIIYKDEDAQLLLKDKSDIIFINNREIVNPIDDSVVRFVDDKRIIIRRARGFVPTPLYCKYNTDGILSLGAENNSYFAIGKDRRIILSQYNGNTRYPENLDFYKMNIEKFSKIYNFRPSHICCDLHPGYKTVEFAKLLAGQLNIPLLQIQHHYAHALAIMAEHEICDNILTVVFDGAGYGPDNKIWGSEFMICNSFQYMRLKHFDYIPLPGGDMAAKQPWRSAIAYANHYNVNLPYTFVNRIGSEKISIIENMQKSNINAPLSCGAGRLFDAISSLTGICDVNNYEGQAAMKLESQAEKNYTEYYDFNNNDPLNNRTLIQSIIKDINDQLPVSQISSRFHNTLIHKVVATIIDLLIKYDLPKKVILTGGCFQNSILLSNIITELNRCNIEVLISENYPLNDGGIALGQAFYGSKNR